MSLPRNELRLMIGDSGLRGSFNGHHLLGIEPVVDPISLRLHQLRARADQRERSVLLVEPFHSRVIEMRELQLDDIAISCLGVLNLFVVRYGREGSLEFAGMISLGVNAKQTQALVERVVDNGASLEQENAYRRWPVSF